MRTSEAQHGWLMANWKPGTIVDTNFSVGTIFGVWPGDKIVGTTGRDLAASGIIVYGPRTVLCVAPRFTVHRILC